MFVQASTYGHFGHESYTSEVEVYYEVPGSQPRVLNHNGKKAYKKKVEFFAWEKLDYVDKIKKEFNLG